MIKAEVTGKVLDERQGIVNYYFCIGQMYNFPIPLDISEADKFNIKDTVVFTIEKDQ